MSQPPAPPEPRRNPAIPALHAHDPASFDPTRQHTVIFEPSGRRGQVPEGASLLDAARRLGVGIESICGGRQTCSKCYIRVEEGDFARHGVASSAAHLSPIGERELYYRHKRGLPEGMRYSCDACVIGDVLVTVPEASQAHKQVVRKGVTPRAIAVNPAVRKFYVEVPAPTMGQFSGEAELLVGELRARFPELGEVTFDYPALRALQPALRAGEQGVTVTLWNEREIVRVEPGYQDRLAGLAVDVGSTTLAVYLCDLLTGQLLATASAMNPQVPYGDDIMSRISYASDEPDGLARLHGLLIEALDELARQAAEEAGLEPEDIVDLVLVGNSVMHHLALELHPGSLGQAPFAPAVHSALDLRSRDLGLRAINPGAHVHVLPLEAGFVGADNVGVLLAEEPHRQDEIVLVIDVGTNGEILLGNRERLLCASSPTGPALEGAHITFGMRAAPGAIERVRIDPATLEARFKVISRDAWSDEAPRQNLGARGICGSGIVEAVAELWKAGVVDTSGRWTRDMTHPRLVEHDGRPGYVLAWPEQTALDGPVIITIADVRAIQLAKAALYTGVKLLMRYRGVERVDRILLAGAFGSYLSPEHAMTIGLIPDCDLARVHAVGNAAGEGAVLALLDRERRAEAARVARWVEHVTMPLESDFQEIFMSALPFPNGADAFPHLEPILRAARERRALRDRAAAGA